MFNVNFHTEQIPLENSCHSAWFTQSLVALIRLGLGLNIFMSFQIFYLKKKCNLKKSAANFYGFGHLVENLEDKMFELGKRKEVEGL